MIYGFIQKSSNTYDFFVTKKIRKKLGFSFFTELGLFHVFSFFFFFVTVVKYF